jgi:hypothetical protein
MKAQTPSFFCPVCEAEAYPHCRLNGWSCGWAVCLRDRTCYDTWDTDNRFTYSEEEWAGFTKS